MMTLLALVLVLFPCISIIRAATGRPGGQSWSGLPRRSMSSFDRPGAKTGAGTGADRAGFPVARAGGDVNVDWTLLLVFMAMFIDVHFC